jgi:hypothetical protein
LPRFILGHRYTPHCQWGERGPGADLAHDQAAARQVAAAIPGSPAELREELLELEQLELEAGRAAEAALEFEEFDPFAEGDGDFLGMDSP